jgi:hypothetical protein
MAQSRDPHGQIFVRGVEYLPLVHGLRVNEWSVGF